MTKKTLDRVSSTNMILRSNNLRDRARDIVKQRLIDCGWRDQVRMACRNYLNDPSTNNSLDDLIRNITPKARALVPDTVKRELLHELQVGLSQLAGLDY